MDGLKKFWGLAAALLLTATAGCSGILFESKGDDGKVDRLRLDSAATWDTIDKKPRNPFKDGDKLNEMNIFLKKETSF